MTKLGQNINISSIETFFTQLAYRLCSEFSESDDSELRGFWCDDIYLPSTHHQLAKKYVNDKRKIIAKAWIGKSGQEVYKATIYFGKKALSRYAKGTDLIDCIPDLKSETEWIEIDIGNKSIEIKLN